LDNYSFVGLDIETTNLNLVDCGVIELSILKLSDGEQKTWCLKPFETDYIDTAALRVNGHKLEDILHQTKEGRERYLDPHKVIVEVENWLALDDCPAEKRCIIAQNGSFDKDRLEQLWTKCGSKDTFPFGRRYIDTMIVELFFDYAKGEFADNYSLKNITKKYGITNSKAHSAASDTIAMKEVFLKQVEYFKKLLK